MSPSGNWKLLGQHLGGGGPARGRPLDVPVSARATRPGAGPGRPLDLECGPEEAERRASQALELARGHGERANEAWVMHLLGRVAAARSSAPVDAALAHLSGAMTLAGELGMRPLVAHCHRDLGRLYRRTGKHPEASEHLATAAAMYEEMDMRFRPEPAVPPSV